MTQKMDMTNLRLDSQGRYVPVEKIPDIDLARDDLVREIAIAAEELNLALVRFREAANRDIDAFVELSAEKYGKNLGGQRGNLTLTSYDGSIRVTRSISETLGFDERLQVAKRLVDACLRDWAKDAKPELQALINDAFQVDKKGRINTGRILTLRRLKIEDPKWERAMAAISESLQVNSSRTYIRVYHRDRKTGAFAQLNLDLANA